ncbi:hypothetical protein H2199_002296 [Coniosporium tulheliwenetii]|uniref:Uncharacterized protein n=1 Tax=Coniosporium tulheliwenetii TaxID=3383036 RepID=A0ACC2ZIE5_9PEZI|nr:hypothetical protein H2199_002296 [Cladosporium sp. JES 115]
MPLGFERLNERTTRPNSLINFIKPLPGPTSATAQDFLERVAAICYPIMEAHHIAVMALEEYEPNPEFVGRNFNAGEVIQLVLKGRRVGGGWQWLSFRSVQMVMMHELAHCKQMNHSGAFWKVRDLYAGDLRGLWARNYTGEGLWGRGRALENGAFMEDGVQAQLEEPKSLCGGTFRSSGRKRKRKGAGKEREKLSYAERQQRRILRKFGANGIALGADEDTKVKLEAGNISKGKPRVAGSARGRELRAAAALARFDQAKTVDVKNEEEGSGSETDSDFDESSSNEVAALDVDGKAMLDMRGHGLVKVCEGEGGDDKDARREMAELQDLEAPPPSHGSDRRRVSKEPAIKNEQNLSLHLPRRVAQLQLQLEHRIDGSSTMAFRLLPRATPALVSRNAATPLRSFQTTARLMETPSGALPVRKPVGAFRGGLFGFLLGTTTAGAGMYYYVLDEYRVSNELLTQDIYTLQTTVQRIESYVKVLEDKVETMSKKK